MSRREVLNAFKKLHRARQHVFAGDKCMLIEGRKQINDNFRKNKDVTDEVEIKKMVQLAKDVEVELRTNVIQAVRKDKDVYELRITEETTKLDNVLFDPYAEIPQPRRRSRDSKNNECCGGSSNVPQASNADKIGQ